MTTTLTDEQIEAAAPAKFESAHWFKQGAQWARDSIADHQALQVQSVEAVAWFLEREGVRLLCQDKKEADYLRGRGNPEWVIHNLYPASALAEKDARIAELESQIAKLEGQKVGTAMSHGEHITVLEAATAVAEKALGEVLRNLPANAYLCSEIVKPALTAIRAVKGK